MTRKKRKVVTDPTIKNLEDIKKLIILYLLKSGSSSREIRDILKMSGSDFNKLIPLRIQKRYKEQSHG
jgi:hypothetical protein